MAPQDISLILTHINVTMEMQSRKKNREPNKSGFFEEMCLPGMTQDFRLPVFFRFFDESKYNMSLDEKGMKQSDEVKAKQFRMVFVCEEASEEVETQLNLVCEEIFKELLAEQLLSFLKQSEVNMYKNYGK